MPSHEELVKLVDQELTGMVNYLKTLPQDAWDHQSACELWTVRDLMGHMVYVMEMVTGGISRGLQGDTTQIEGWPAAGTDAATRMRFADTGARERTESLGEQLFPRYQQLVQRGIELAKSLGPDDWEKLCYRPAGIRPVSELISTVISETVIHRWDIQSQLEPSAHLSPGSLLALVDRMPRLVVFRPGPKLDSPHRYRFDVSGAVIYQGDIVIEGDKVRSEPAGPATPDMTFRCDTETFLLLMYGRLKYEAAVADGGLVAEGKPELLAQYVKWLG